MKKIKVILVIFVAVFTMTVFTSSPTIHAAELNSVQENSPSSIIVASPSAMFHKVTIISAGLGPYSFIFNDPIGGVWYTGILYKVQQEYNPEVGYITRYEGTVYKK